MLAGINTWARLSPSSYYQLPPLHGYVPQWAAWSAYDAHDRLACYLRVAFFGRYLASSAAHDTSRYPLQSYN